MVLKREVVELSDGKKIEVKKLSFAAQLRLAELTKIVEDKDGKKIEVSRAPRIVEYLKECLSVEDYKLLEEIDEHDGIKLKEVMIKVNGWDIPEPDPIKKKENGTPNSG